MFMCEQYAIHIVKCNSHEDNKRVTNFPTTLPHSLVLAQNPTIHTLVVSRKIMVNHHFGFVNPTNKYCRPLFQNKNPSFNAH